MPRPGPCPASGPRRTRLRPSGTPRNRSLAAPPRNPQPPTDRRPSRRLNGTRPVPPPAPGSGAGVRCCRKHRKRSARAGPHRPAERSERRCCDPRARQRRTRRLSLLVCSFSQQWAVFNSSILARHKAGKQASRSKRVEAREIGRTQVLLGVADIVGRRQDQLRFTHRNRNEGRHQRQVIAPGLLECGDHAGTRLRLGDD